MRKIIWTMACSAWLVACGAGNGSDAKPLNASSDASSTVLTYQDRSLPGTMLVSGSAGAVAYDLTSGRGTVLPKVSKDVGDDHWTASGDRASAVWWSSARDYLGSIVVMS